MEDQFAFPAITPQNYPKTFHELRYWNEQAIHTWLGLLFSLIKEAGKQFASNALDDQREVALGIFLQSASIERVDALTLPPEQWEKAFADPEAEKQKILSVLSLGFDAMRVSPNLNKWLDAIDQARQERSMPILSVGGQFLVERFRAARRR